MRGRPAPNAINVSLFSQLPYDPEKDIAPVTMLTTLPSALTVPASLGVNTVAEFIALLKKDPTKDEEEVSEIPETNTKSVKMLHK